MKEDTKQKLWEIQRIYETQLANGNRTIQLNVPSFEFLLQQLTEKDATIKLLEEKYSASLLIGTKYAEDADRLRYSLESLTEWIRSKMESMGKPPAYSYQVGVYHGMEQVLKKIESGEVDTREGEK